MQFYLYNAVLRRWPTDVFQQLETVDNFFVTTIHVLVSAVQKIARVMKLPEGLVLFRGLGGTTELPDHFRNVDDNGCRGFAEWGFMSTTAEKSIAIQYSGVKEGKPLAMLFEIQVSSVDRGACIQDFSQYPGEVEYLWVPCSFIEPYGNQYLEVTLYGVVCVVRVRVNANLKALTVDDIVQAKKQAHVASFKYLLDETKRDIWNRAALARADERWSRDLSVRGQYSEYTLERFLNGIVGQCNEVFSRHERESPDVYNNSESFRGMVIEMLDVRATAVSKLELWLQDESRLLHFDHELQLRVAHRLRIAYLERKLPREESRVQAALELCRVKGLIQNSVQEMNDLHEVRIISAAAEDVSCRSLSLLVQAGSNVNAVDGNGETPLMKAAIAGHADAVEILVAIRAEINQKSNAGDTALILATQEGQADCVRTLGNLKADINVCEKNDLPAIYFAAQQGHVECVSALLKLGSDPHFKNVQRQTFLITAAYYGHPDCVQVFLKAGVDMDAADEKGFTAAMFCAFLGNEGHEKCLQALKDAGADMSLKDKRGKTALDYSKEYNHSRCSAILESAQRGGCNVTCQLSLRRAIRSIAKISP